MTKNIIVGCAGLVALGGVAGCQREPTQPGNIPGGAETGMLRVLLGSETAAAEIDPRVEEVWVRIDSVEARHEDEGWVTVSDERQDFDLMAGAGGMGGGQDDNRDDDEGGRPGRGGDDRPGLDAIGGGDAGEGGGMGGAIDLDGYELLGEAEVWTGAYNKIHLGITDAWILVDGQQQDLEFIGNIDPLDPFDTGLTANQSFFVDQDSTTSARIQWDLGENLSEKDNGRWMLGANTQIRVDIEEGAGGVAGGGGAGGGGGGGNY